MISKRPATETDKTFLVWLEETCMREYAIALWGSWSPDLSVRNCIDGCQIIVDDGMMWAALLLRSIVTTYGSMNYS
jgi:hypothetical protein